MRQKQVIRLKESDLHRMIKESVKQVLKESAYPRQQRRQLKEYTTMQGSIDNGFNFPPEAEQYLAKRNTFFGNIAKLAQQNNG